MTWHNVSNLAGLLMALPLILGPPVLCVYAIREAFRKDTTPSDPEATLHHTTDKAT